MDLLMQANISVGEQSPARTFAEAARRAQIVGVAIKVVATGGYPNASFARIAKEAGLSSTGIISYHFAGKDDLMREVIAEVMRAATEHLQPRIDAAVGARAKLRAYIHAHMSFLTAHPHHLRALVEVVGNLPRDTPERVEFIAQLDAIVGFHTDYIREGQAAGEFGQFDPRVMVIAIQGAIDAVVLRKLREPGLDVERCGHELADLFDRATRPT